MTGNSDVVTTEFESEKPTSISKTANNNLRLKKKNKIQLK